MPASLAGIETKIRRAERHQIDLQLRVHEWRKAHPAHIVHDKNTETGWHVLRIEELPDPPDEWSAILGDFANNLRSALEYVIELLIVANNGTPTQTNKFPILSERNDKAIAANLKGVAPLPALLIKEMQPYNRRNRSKPEPLEILGGLSNVDKHHHLHGIATLQVPFEVPAKMLVGTQFVILEIRQRLGVGEPISNAELQAFRVGPANAVIDFQTYQNVPYEVAFGDGAVPIGELRNLVSVVRSIVKRLTPYLIQPVTRDQS